MKVIVVDSTSMGDMHHPRRGGQIWENCVAVHISTAVLGCKQSRDRYHAGREIAGCRRERQAAFTLKYECSGIGIPGRRYFRKGGREPDASDTRICGSGRKKRRAASGGRDYLRATRSAGIRRVKAALPRVIRRISGLRAGRTLLSALGRDALIWQRGGKQ
ncbi:MAG: hypothetical protein ACLRSW_05600 [Christensenellaceae bacterium]